MRFSSNRYIIILKNLISLNLVVEINRPLVYIKAFSTGSCRNYCGGGIATDCSCNKDCEGNGTCCSDYNTCTTLVINTSSIDNCRNVANCKLCNTSTNQCGQCEANYYL